MIIKPIKHKKQLDFKTVALLFEVWLNWFIAVESEWLNASNVLILFVDSARLPESARCVESALNMLFLKLSIISFYF